MNYKPVPRSYGPVLDTEYGSYTSPYFTYDPNQYVFRQPAASQALVTTRHPVIDPPQVNSIRTPFLTGYRRGTGLSGEFTPEPVATNSPLAGFLFVAGVFGILYLLTKGGVKRNPKTSGNPMISVDVPARALEGAFHERAAYSPRTTSRRRRSSRRHSSEKGTKIIRGRRYSVSALKKLRAVGRKVARAMNRDKYGRFTR